MKACQYFSDSSVLMKSFNFFILSYFQYCSPVWFSAANLHLRLLERNQDACKILFPELNTDLWHHRSWSYLCMLFKVYHNPAHPLHLELPGLFHLARETRNAVHSHSHSFSVVQCSTTQYSKCFLPASTKCWNDLPSGVVECLELQKFKVGANKYLLDRHI